TGTSEFNEVFFDGARTRRDLVVGSVGDGWRVAMGTLSFERGVATLGQQIGFERELGRLVEAARRSGRSGAPRQAGPGVDRAGGHARARAGHAGGRPGGSQHRAVGAEGAVVPMAPGAR